MKKSLLLILILCSFFLTQVKADEAIPVIGSFTITSVNNTSGFTTDPIDCSAPGQAHISIHVVSPSTSTVNIQISSNKSLWSNYSSIPIINATSGIADFNSTTSYPFWRITSATTGVAFTVQWGCK